MSLVVERVQYGVGQGAFHTQSITIDRNCFLRGDLDFPQTGLRFDFVFDCGVKSTKGNDVHDSIKHYRPKRTLSDPKANEVVDALFISHFHDDHINGIEQLCKAKTVQRIFAPFYTKEDVLAVILRSPIASFTGVQAVLFLTELRNLYRQDRLFGRPTIYVVSSEMENQFDPPGSLTNPELPPFPEGVRVSDSVNNKACFTDKDALEFGPSNTDWQIWEIKTWHFRQHHPTPSPAWETAMDQLKTVFGGIFSSSTVIDAAEAKMLMAQANTIQKALCDALKTDKVTYAEKHNLVSMCVYSGPTERCYRPRATSSSIHRMNGPDIGNLQTGLHFDFSVYSPRLGHVRGGGASTEYVSNRTGWLGTGDAMLGNATVWKNFDDRLKWCTWRSDRVATVQVPHHGSAGQYYNPNLFDNPETLAVISAGAYSSYGHPTLAVLSDILQRGNPVVHVHEFVRPGLIEVIKVDYY